MEGVAGKETLSKEINGRNQENRNKESYMWRMVETELKIKI